MDIEPTTRGYIEDENDALLVLQATLDGRLKDIPRRPYEVERKYLITSGAIFVFIEGLSGIKRWTDGISWSPSRISGKFLVYKELDKSSPQYSCEGTSRKRTSSSSRASSPSSSSCCDGADRRSLSPLSGQTQRAPPPIAPYQCQIQNQHFYRHQQCDSKYTGFVKKTMSVKIKTGGMTSSDTVHVVSYYDVADIQSGNLIRPRDLPFLREMKPSRELMIAMEHTSLGSHSKPSLTNPLQDTNTAGSIRDSEVPEIPEQQRQKLKLENHHSQSQQPVLPHMHTIPGLKIPSLASVYNNNNINNYDNDNNNKNDNDNENDRGTQHPKFTRLVGNPLPNPYLSSPTTATSINILPPPSVSRMINKADSRFCGFPLSGYIYYGTPPQQNNTPFHPLPTAVPQGLTTVTQLPHPLTGTVTNKVPRAPTMAVTTPTTPTMPIPMPMPSLSDLQHTTSSGPTIMHREPADAAD